MVAVAEASAPAREIVLRAFDRGVTHFDLANNYGPPPGSAEQRFGRILTDDLGAHRDDLVIATKAGYQMQPGPYGEWGSRKYLLASLDASLRRIFARLRGQDDGVAGGGSAILLVLLRRAASSC